jgi:hypothetical protein
MQVAALLRPMPKPPAPVRSEPYRRYVAALPCWMCGIVGSSQAAHSDEGKGLALKSCDLTCYPLCGPNNGVCGCHYTVGTSGTLTRAERRSLEQQAAAQTKTTLISMSGSDKKLRSLLVKLGLVR